MGHKAKKEKALEKTLADQAQARRDKNKAARERKVLAKGKAEEASMPAEEASKYGLIDLSEAAEHEDVAQHENAEQALGEEREEHVRDLTLVVLGGRAERDDELHEAEAPEDEQLAEDDAVDEGRHLALLALGVGGGRATGLPH